MVRVPFLLPVFLFLFPFRPSHSSPAPGATHHPRAVPSRTLLSLRQHAISFATYCFLHSPPIHAHAPSLRHLALRFTAVLRRRALHAAFASVFRAAPPARCVCSHSFLLLHPCRVLSHHFLSSEVPSCCCAACCLTCTASAAFFLFRSFVMRVRSTPAHAFPPPPMSIVLPSL